MKSNTFSQPRRSKLPSHIRKSSTHSKSNNRSKSRQKSSRSHSRSKQQQISAQTSKYSSNLKDQYNKQDRSHSKSKSGGKFQIKLTQNKQQSNFNSYSNTKLNSIKKQHHKKRQGRESLDLTQIQQRQIHDKRRKQQMLENTVNNYHRSYYQHSNDYDQDEDRPRSYSRSNSKKSRKTNNSSLQKHNYANNDYQSYQSTPQNQYQEERMNSTFQSDGQYTNDKQRTQNNNIKKINYHQNRAIKQPQNYTVLNQHSNLNIRNNQTQYYNDREDVLNDSNYKLQQSYNSDENNDQHSDVISVNNDQTIHKELAKYKARVYDYKYKLDSLKNRLCESEDQCQVWKDKFELEQDKTDEFFSKAEKYKLLTKDFRKDNETMKIQLEQLKEQNEKDVKNYETIIRLKDEKEARFNDEVMFLQQRLIENLRNLQISASQIDNNCLLIEPINALFENIQQLQFVNENSQNTLQQSRQYNEVTLSNDNNQSQNMAYICDGRDKFKISSDAIMFNGESLNQDDYTIQKEEIQQNQLPSNGNLHQDHSQFYESNRAQTPFHQNIKLNNQSQSTQHHESHSQIYMQNQGTQQYTNQLHNISQTQQQTQQQYDILLKIQQEMAQLREQSSKVLEENQALQEKNVKLNEELTLQKQRSEQSLMPQYKDAFEQMRRANENMQKKIEKLEKESTKANLTSPIQNQKQQENLNINKIENDLKNMQSQIQKISYENSNLRMERDSFVNQIQNLESYNKKQEQMFHFFQQQAQNSHNTSYISQTPHSQPLKIQENYDASSQNTSVKNLFQRKQSNNSLINSASTNNMKNKMSKILDQHTEYENHPIAISDYSKSPHSQYHLSNRLPTSQNTNNHQVQAFTLNQVTQSDFNLTQSYLNKNNFVNKGPGLTMTQFQPDATQSDLYIDTTANDKQDLIVIVEKENLFSLSSTQPENQMRLSSPINYLTKNINFNLNNPSSSKNAQHYQLNTGNFKQSTMKDAQSHSNLQLNQIKYLHENENFTLLNAETQQRLRSPHDQLRVQEIMQTQSQEVTNRDKSGGRNNNINTITMQVSSTIQKSNSDVSSSQLPCMIIKNQGLDNSFQQMQNQVIQEISIINQIKPGEQHNNSYKLKSNLNDISSESQISISDRSLEQHLIQNRVARQNSKHDSQETFQPRNINNSINSQNHLQTRPTHNNNQPTQNYIQQHNKENMIMVEDDMVFKNHQYSQQSRIMSSKLKSPAFYESNHMNSDSETNTFTNNQDRYQQQAIFNQQIILDGLINQVGINPNQSDSYCTTDKQNTLTSGFLSGLTQTMGLQGNTTNGELKNISSNTSQMSTKQQNQVAVNTSQQSNFMSQRTMNLKKEITSLDEEIYQLQNSLKQALVKKSNQLEETIE